MLLQTLLWTGIISYTAWRKQQSTAHVHDLSYVERWNTIETILVKIHILTSEAARNDGHFHYFELLPLHNLNMAIMEDNQRSIKHACGHQLKSFQLAQLEISHSCNMRVHIKSPMKWK